MGLDAQKRARLGENILVCLLADLLVDLQGDKPAVPSITGAQQRHIASTRNSVEDLVPRIERLHRSLAYERARMSATVTAPRLNASLANRARRGPPVSSRMPNLSKSRPRCCLTAACVTTNASAMSRTEDG